MKKNSPLISIIIVNWNGKKWLKTCLDSLAKQTYKNFEILFVDNASNDDSVEYVKKMYPHVAILQTGSNSGFAGGNNYGLKRAKGEYILLLNNDTAAPKDLLKKLLKGFEEFPNAGCIQPKMVLLDDPYKIDSVGSYWTDTSFLYYYGLGKNSELAKYNKSMQFFSNKGACVMIPKDITDKIGLFDEDFWCYYEETDFCHRVWLVGYECWYYPKTIIYHAGGGTALRFDNSFIQFHNFKNKLMSFLKNFETGNLFMIIPIYIFLNIVISFIWLFQGKLKHFLALYQAIGWNIMHFSSTQKKRKQIQSIRKKTDAQIFSITKKNPTFSYYITLLRGNTETYTD
ncbi:MAG: glycosyltransferase family 2 protein [Candidatus Levyibacteriota bacterium]